MTVAPGPAARNSPLAIFEWIEGLYNPIRRYSGLGYRCPNDFENFHSAATATA